MYARLEVEIEGSRSLKRQRRYDWDEGAREEPQVGKAEVAQGRLRRAWRVERLFDDVMVVLML